MGRIDANIVIGEGILPTDPNLFFADNSGVLTEDVEEFPANVRWPDLLAHYKIFPSKSDARRNGWDKNIKEGWSDITVGKLKHRLCVLKILS